MRSMLTTALLAATLAASAPAPAEKVLVYPRVELKDGLPVLTLNVWNRESAPRTVCVDPSCLTLKYEASKGAWAVWHPTPKPDAKPLEASAFVQLKADEQRDLFVMGAQLPITPAPVTFEYRATAEAVAFAAGLDSAPLVKGPLGPSSSPTVVVSMTQAQALAAVLRGEFNAHLHLRPGDASVLNPLEAGFHDADARKQEEIARAVIQTGVAEAAPVLVRLAQETKSTQVRATAIHGFAVIHPASFAPELARLASDPLVTKSELPELLQSGLARAIALSKAPDALGLLAKLQTTLEFAPVMSQTSPEHSLAFALPISRIRAGDGKAVAPLVGRLKKARPEVLAQALRATPFAKSKELGCALAGFLDDPRAGMRIAPFREYAAPRTPEQRKAIDDFEKNAYDRVQDEALFAIVQLVPEARGDLAVGAFRRVAADELAAARKRLAKECRR